ncbi:MAG TPA: hypothetical protein VFE62_25525 [Gemmataceae bacterium]|nr:hypothetical protein [Gemmataceae bacterium]
MPTPWLKSIKEGKKLAVFNSASSWAVPIKAAVNTFNGLKFGVTLALVDDEKKANIVLRVATGPDTYDWPGNSAYEGTTVKTRTDFTPSRLHGQTTTIKDPSINEIMFAVTFLPGNIVNATDRQKEVVVVHEFIHACGLDGGRGAGKQDPGQDHDIVGIMVAQMTQDGTGLIEILPDKGAKPMTPIRVGGQTLCLMQMLWAGGKECKK